MSGCHGVAGRQLLPPQTQLIIEIRIIWHCDPAQPAAQSAAQQPQSGFYFGNHFISIWQSKVDVENYIFGQASTWRPKCN